VSSVELWSLLIGLGAVFLVFRLLIYEAWRFHRARHELVRRRGSRMVGVEKSKDSAPPDLPEVAAYEQFAAIWHEYAAVGSPDYAAFLPALARYYRFPIASVLDLACGTGALTRQLAQTYECVTGLDLSPAMLGRARTHCDGLHNVRLVQADFRHFDLGEEFDAVVCAFDSMNYLSRPADLSAVFQCVARHLRPGGFFVFDALNTVFFTSVKGVTAHLEVGETVFELRHLHHPEEQTWEGQAVFESAFERHWRQPVEEAQVDAAAAANGFAVTEVFSGDGFRYFFVLRKRSAVLPVQP
jgi:SAM-dependent methyltransferase